MQNHVATTCMPLDADTRIVKNQSAKTMYITIPAFLAEDSAFPFEDGSKIKVEIVTEEVKVTRGCLVVRPANSATSKRK